VTTIWTAHQNSQTPSYENNFRATNKLSLHYSRATTSRAQSAFRRTARPALPRFQLGVGDKTVLLPEEAHPYGKPNRPGTPVGDVVSNYYGINAEKDISKKYDYLSAASKPLSLSYARGHTRASAMAHNHVSLQSFNKSMKKVESEGEIFKMSKFRNVKARNDTFNHRKFPC
jgi:hypothetical protein